MSTNGHPVHREEQKDKARRPRPFAALAARRGFSFAQPQNSVTRERMGMSEAINFLKFNLTSLTSLLLLTKLPLRPFNHPSFSLGLRAPDASWRSNKRLWTPEGGGR
jgi:hypothetical protein